MASLIENAYSHLLVTRPSKSCALETFVVERAEQSTHSALLVRDALEIIRRCPSELLLSCLDAMVHADISHGPIDY